MALYNTMRPKRFSEVLGQDDNVALLKSMLSGKESLPNGLLLVGGRGTGKTTCARIFAKSLNCKNPSDDGPCGVCESCISSERTEGSMDIIELDAASHNSVDDVRAIVESAQYSPLGDYKVFIIDECHMLTTSAWNAILKTVEEPPKGVIFIFCTTEVHKVLLTIRSRCRELRFKQIQPDVIEGKLISICKEFQKEYEPNALKIISKAADGALRDAEKLLEDYMSDDVIREEKVSKNIGMSDIDVAFNILLSVASGETAKALDGLSDASASGNSFSFMIEAFINVLKDTIYLSEGGDEKHLYNTEAYIASCIKLSNNLTRERAFSWITQFAEVQRYATKEMLEVLLLKLISEEVPVYVPSVNAESVEAFTIRKLTKRIEDLENCLITGEIPESVTKENPSEDAERVSTGSLFDMSDEELSKTFDEVSEEIPFEELPLPEDVESVSDEDEEVEVPFDEIVNMQKTESDEYSLPEPAENPLEALNNFSMPNVDLKALLPKGAVIGTPVSIEDTTKTVEVKEEKKDTPTDPKKALFLKFLDGMDDLPAVRSLKK